MRSYPTLSTISQLLKGVSVPTFLVGVLLGLFLLGGGETLGFVAGIGVMVGCTASAVSLWALAEAILVLVNIGVDVSSMVASMKARQPPPGPRPEVPDAFEQSVIAIQDAQGLLTSSPLQSPPRR